MKLFRQMMLLALLAFGMGCATEAPRVSVSGQVKYQGKPVPTGTVTFIADDGKTVVSGPIKNGEYTVARAPVGPVKIAVNTPPPAGSQTLQKVPGKTFEGPTDTPVQVPSVYASAETTTLKYTVTSVKTQTHHIVVP
jgi:hypothetical protein